MAVYENRKRMAFAHYEHRHGWIFPDAPVQFCYAIDSFGNHGFWLQHGRTYPTTVSFAGSIIQKYTLAWSFILTIASLGAIIMPSIIGKIAETAGIYYGMQSIITVVIIDFLCVVVLVWYIRKLRQNKITV